jgi:hypothetical protein
MLGFDLVVMSAFIIFVIRYTQRQSSADPAMDAGLKKKNDYSGSAG